MLGNLISRDVKRQIKRLVPYFQRLQCPVCEEYAHSFLTLGVVPRINAGCPSCGSRERHRLIWHYLKTKTDLFNGKPKRFIHFAPEPAFEERFAKLPNIDYLTADLFAPNVMAKVDITQIPFPDQSFDVVYCSHILEHVPDDRLAMRECRRVLKPDGWAVFMVPITAEVTIEDPTISDPKERERLFGQDDHVRRYGPDFVDRLKESGFKVTVFRATDISDDLRKKYAIPDDEGPVYFCRP